MIIKYELVYLERRDIGFVFRVFHVFAVVGIVDSFEARNIC